MSTQRHFENGCFAIARGNCKPLVTTERLSYHLALMHAFANLKQHVMKKATEAVMPPAYTEQSVSNVSASRPLSPEVAWNAFLHRAVQRFEMYAASILEPRLAASFSLFQPSDLARVPFGTWVQAQDQYGPFLSRRAIEVPANRMPPLDVALIWHAYLLTPSRYHEDCVLQPHRLALHRCAFPLQLLVSRLFLSDGEPILQVQRAATLWSRVTGTPFDPLDVMPWERPLSTFPVKCPSCLTELSVPWLDVATGDRWHKSCPAANCSQTISLSTLQGKVFVDDLMRWTQSGSSPEGYRLRGGLLAAADGRFLFKDPYAPLLSRMFANGGGAQSRHGAMVQDIASDEIDVYGPMKPSMDVVTDFLGPPQSFNLDAIARDFLSKAIGAVQPNHWEREDIRVRTDHLFRFYMESIPWSYASADLVATARRQDKFYTEISNLSDWAADEHGAVQILQGFLQSAVLRYHRWLRLLYLNPDRFIAPTLDIDLAWHTHQLHPEYYTQCFSAVGRFIDHDDRVDEQELARAFERARRLWFEEYGLPYSRFTVRYSDGVRRRTMWPLRRAFGNRPQGNPAEEPTVVISAASAVDERMADGPSTHCAVQVVAGVRDMELGER